MTIARATSPASFSPAAGTAMGGVDKGLVELAGSRWSRTCFARLAPQVDTLLINANQNLERYAAFGHPVVADAVGGFAGPLAGLHAGSTPPDARSSSPCPAIRRSCRRSGRAAAAALDARDAQLAVARTFDQPHPVFALVRRDVLPNLAAFLDAGGRKIDAWYAALARGRSRVRRRGRRVSQHQHRATSSRASARARV